MINLINLLNNILSKEKDENIERFRLGILGFPLLLSWREVDIADINKQLFIYLLKIIHSKFENINDMYFSLKKKYINDFFSISNPFWKDLNEKDKELINKFNVNEFSLIIPIYQLNIGYVIKLKIKGINNLIEKNIIKRWKNNDENEEEDDEEEYNEESDSDDKDN